MDKYELKVSMDEIDRLISERRFKEAADVADQIEWERMRSVYTLCRISDLYKINKRYEDSRDLLLIAYERNPSSRKIIYSLCELELKLNNYIHALQLYNAFINVAPKDPDRYVLQYKLYKKQDVNVYEQIAVLEEFLQHDFRERWAYELATLYLRAGEEQRCISQCDEIVAYFGDGRFVIRALELKKSLTDLTPQQEERLEILRSGGTITPPAPAQEEVPAEEESAGEKEPAAEKESLAEKESAAKKVSAAEEEPAEEKEPVRDKGSAAEKEAAAAKKSSSEKESAAAEKSSSEKESAADIEPAVEKESAAADDSSADEESADEKESVSDKKSASKKEPASDKKAASKKHSSKKRNRSSKADVSAEKEDAAEENAGAAEGDRIPEDSGTESADATAAASEETADSGDSTELSATPEEYTDALLRDVKMQETIARGMREIGEGEYDSVLAQETSGQMAMVMEEEPPEDIQIEGQLNLEQIMSEWEKIRRESEQQRLAQARRRILEQSNEAKRMLYGDNFEQTGNGGGSGQTDAGNGFGGDQAGKAPGQADAADSSGQPDSAQTQGAPAGSDGQASAQTGTTRSWKKEDVERRLRGRR